MGKYMEGFTTRCRDDVRDYKGKMKVPKNGKVKVLQMRADHLAMVEYNGERHILRKDRLVGFGMGRYEAKL